MDKNDRQGGKRYGELLGIQEKKYNAVNKDLIDGDVYKDDEDIEIKLQNYKIQFMEADEDLSGDIDIMELKRMLEKLGQAKTHLELTKMIAEVDTTNRGTINYEDFITMMLGSKTSVLKLILLFEEKMKLQAIPKGRPRRKTLDELP